MEKNRIEMRKAIRSSGGAGAGREGLLGFESSLSSLAFPVSVCRSDALRRLNKLLRRLRRPLRPPVAAVSAVARPPRTPSCRAPLAVAARFRRSSMRLRASPRSSWAWTSSSRTSGRAWSASLPRPSLALPSLSPLSQTIPSSYFSYFIFIHCRFSNWPPLKPCRLPLT